jgi:exopolyphosphatase/pppGpp-phosphohydrolase
MSGPARRSEFDHFREEMRQQLEELQTELRTAKGTATEALYASAGAMVLIVLHLVGVIRT